MLICESSCVKSGQDFGENKEEKKMRWNRFRIKTRTEAEDMVNCVFEFLSGRGRRQRGDTGESER